MFNLKKLFGQRKPEQAHSTVRIRQSDWTRQGASAVKKWGITGMLNTGGEYEVLIDLSYSRSNVSGHVEPHVFIFMQPNTFGNVDGFIVMQFARDSAPLEASFITAKIGLSDDGSVLIMPTDREGTIGIDDVLRSGEPFRILLIDNNKEVAFRGVFPNDTNRLGDITKTLPIG